MTSIKLVLVLALLVLIAGGAVWLFTSPQKATVQNRNMAQWLQFLRANTNSTGNPLDISQIVCDTQSQLTTVEVPLSYDLLKQHDFLETRGKFHLIINGRALSAACGRAPNGNCWLRFDQTELPFGTNQIQIEFMIFDPSDRDHFLQAIGPIKQLVTSNSIPAP